MAAATSSATSAEPSPAPSSSIDSVNNAALGTGFGIGAGAGAGADAAAASAPAETAPDDSSKLRTLMGILRKFIGVADIAAVRFSLPAHLLEPTPNLEYWGYMDRPETFVNIGESTDPFGRMVNLLRFWFTKDLKYVKGKPVKPYNSVLGEFFRCTWEVENGNSSATTTNGSVNANNTGSTTTATKPIKVAYLTEQTSHHPPVSAFWIECPEKGIYARGYDQLSAKFTGTNVRVTPGAHNLGIFITLRHYDDEMYRLTHPAAYLGGLLRGSLSVNVADTCYITCPKTKIKVILQYMEEGWLSRAQNKVEGVIFKYNPDKDSITRIKDVSDKDVLGRIDGIWTDKIYYSVGSKSFNKAEKKELLIDLNPLFALPKIVPPLESQLPNESRKFWNSVTNAIHNKQYSYATTLKRDIEEKQRAKASGRKTSEGENPKEWRSRFFTVQISSDGRPELTEEGKEVIRRLEEGKYELAENPDF